MSSTPTDPPCSLPNCGLTFYRGTNCYNVPAGTVFDKDWVSKSLKVDPSMCNNTSPAYATTDGSVVTRDPNGDIVTQEKCNACQYVVGVGDWASNCCGSPCCQGTDCCTDPGSVCEGFKNDTPGTCTGANPHKCYPDPNCTFPKQPAPSPMRLGFNYNSNFKSNFNTNYNNLYHYTACRR